jgi:hypothetical protein
MTTLARMLIIVALVVLPGCVTTHTTIGIEYAIPKQYGDGKVAITSTLTR